MRLKQILVVDDSVIVRQLISLYLMKYIPCEISEAGDGVQALEKIMKERFDLVVTDINMPLISVCPSSMKTTAETRPGCPASR